jgi:hypothetical protein
MEEVMNVQVGVQIAAKADSRTPNSTQKPKGL